MSTSINVKISILVWTVKAAQHYYRAMREAGFFRGPIDPFLGISSVFYGRFLRASSSFCL